MRVAKWTGGIAMTVLLAGALGLGRRPARGTGAEECAQPAPGLPHKLVGTASCSARACHGRIEPVPGQAVRQDEFSTWTAHDKHAQAYQVLETDRSKKIEGLLKQLPDWQTATPHADRLCLTCHVHQDYSSARRVERLSDRDFEVYGVGCESCHGSASNWLKAHTSDVWKRMTADEKGQKGMKRTKDLLVRADLCVTCHVGSAGADVNHDLIAAGHPRMNFEFGAFMANLPQHWGDQDEIEKNKKSDPLFETRTWAVGQVVTAQTALRLLEYRADPAAKPPDGASEPWPEFAEYDCFSCHHDLRDKSWRQDRDWRRLGLKPGTLRWSDWYTLMPRNLAEFAAEPDRQAFEALAGLMSNPQRHGQEIAAKARSLVDQMNGLKNQLAKGQLIKDAADRRRLLAKLIDAYLKGEPGDWDHAAQLYLAIAALEGDGKDDLKRMAEALTFPPGYDGPKDFDPKEKFKGLLEQIRKKSLQ
jgi:hypothetical protein